MISGANRGIGRAIAKRLYLEGYRLSLGARKVDDLSNITRDMHPDRFCSHHYEAPYAGIAHTWVSATIEKFGKIDGLVNNAGVMFPFSLEDDEEDTLDKMWDINVKGPLRLTRAAYPYLKRSGKGRIVNIVSLSGKRIKSATIGAYAMSKHAALALTHATRYNGWKHGIRCTAICPGFVATDMTSNVTSLPQEQMTRPESIAHLTVMILALPNTASVAELPVNCVLESTY
jgi:NAD(P)-dependent dehydrogenase (short-subunit alcohol dehydrogenase family)